MGFYSELKRRNVVRLAGVYVVVGWVLVQVASTLEEAISLPEWFDAVTVAFLVIAFPIALIFAWAFELTPEGLKRTADVPADESITAQTGSKLDVLLIGSFLIFAGVMAAERFLPERAAPASTETEATVSQNQPAVNADSLGGAASIAVLPFADLSQKGDQEYFADGISEELLNVLAQVKGMKVAGRTSSFAFKGRNEDLREIGRVLNVAHILEGSVRSQGDRVRVTAQLIQVSDGFHLWSETYDRDLLDIFAVQDDIAQKILVAMTDQLMVDEAPSIARAARTDIDAYGLFLEARDLIFSRNVEKMERALELLNRALQIDENYAPAYALRAKALTLLSDRPGSYGSLPAREALIQSVEDVETALALDPGLADAYAVQGLISADTGRPDFAVSTLRRALELNPNSLDARNWLALALSYNGRFRDVMEQLKTLNEIDPLYRPGVTNVMSYAAEIGELETARRAARRYLSISDDDLGKRRVEARLAFINNDFVAGVRVLETLGDEADTANLTDLRFSWHALGVVGENEGTGRLLSAYLPYEVALRGETDAAVAMARQAVQDFPDFFTAHRVYITVLSFAGRYEELMDYFRAEYRGELDTFERVLRPSVSADPPPYEHLALAANAVGDDTTYADALRRWRFTIDMFRAGGSVTQDRDLDESRYFAIAGDEERCLELLKSAMDKRRLVNLVRFADPAYRSLHSNPRFQALREENLQQVNEVRAELDLSPVNVSFYDRFYE